MAVTGDGEDGDAGDAGDAVEPLLVVVGKLFSPGTSKIVLQVGLCALVKNLHEYPSLLPAYIDVLLKQPAGYRQRVLHGPMQKEGSDGLAPATRRLAYVMGTSSRTYEECCIAHHWPSLEIARTLAMQSEAANLSHFEPEHLDVLLAALPDLDLDLEEEWLSVFDKLRAYVLVALIDPALHRGATDAVRRFWLCRPRNIALKALESSKKTLLQTFRVMYGDSTEQDRVPESDLLAFLSEMRDAGGAIPAMLQQVVDQFREAHNTEFQRSRLETLFE